jgi:crotonobetainyl-CoA:carnitine CoA-transferase CaiB-like acyl-CoA transferase
VLHRHDVVEALGSALRSRSRDEWLERLGRAKVPAGPVRDLAEVLRDPALERADMVRRSVAGAPAEGIALLGAPWRVGGRRPPLRLPPLRLPPPRLGEHTREFMERFAGRAAPVPRGSRSRQPRGRSARIRPS